MRLPLSWLSEFLTLEKKPSEIASALGSLGIEVDGMDMETGECVLELSLTPNLGHALSVLGIARELSAYFGIPYRLPTLASPWVETMQTLSLPTLSIEARPLCRKYCCIALDGVGVASSPDWLATRLDAAGIRRVNNIVDITNYVMLELGQPLHAFDFDRLEGEELIVTCAKHATLFALIDGKTVTIPQGALLVSDSAKPVALAGIMGGENSSVLPSTTRLLVEAAHFDAAAIRRTARGLGLRTESSARFERGIDPEMPAFALKRAASLIQATAGGHIASPIQEEGDRFMAKAISCRVGRIRSLLGVHIGVSECEDLFRRLEMKVEPASGEDALSVIPPSYRNDVKEEVDLVEEIGRLYGYQNIPASSPRHITSPVPDDPFYLLEKKVTAHLLAAGLQELITCNLISAKEVSWLGSFRDPLAVLHPTSQDQSHLRPAFLPGFLKVLKKNSAFHNDTLSAFEVGRLHYKRDGHAQEERAVGIVCTGRRDPKSWNEEAHLIDFFDLKGLLENFLNAHGALEKCMPSGLLFLHPHRQAVWGGGLGYFGEVHPDLLRAIDLPRPVYFAELPLAPLLKTALALTQMTPLPLFPGTYRDWTCTLKADTPIEALFDAIAQIPSLLLKEHALISLYTSDMLGKDKKKATFRFFYRNDVKTIDTAAADREHSRILARLTHFET